MKKDKVNNKIQKPKESYIVISSNQNPYRGKRICNWFGVASLTLVIYKVNIHAPGTVPAVKAESRHLGCPETT